MTRIVSLVALVAVLLVIGGLFFRVMIGFLLPLFLAVVLVVMFGPVHRWILARCGGHDRIAAGLTTLAIILLILVPVSLVVVLAASEGVRLYRSLELDKLELRALTEYVAGAAERVGIALSADDIETTVNQWMREWLAPLVLGTGKHVGSTLVSLGIMIVAVYYFLADGPGMIRTIMRLSPLDDRYEQQLIDQFTSLSRAIVLATVLSAVVQGLLASVGYWLAGFDSIFLLMLLTMLFAMIPFVGPAAVWLPAALWLLATGRTVAGVLLIIYGAGVVSMVDNLIRPMILQGRSNLHPLLALLSVLGGVQVLGPIGIFIGPMVVAFLQTLLKMFHAEMEAMGAVAKPETIEAAREE